MQTFFSSKRRLMLSAGFLVAFLVVFNFSTYVLYKRSKDYLDTELGERLRSVATTLSHAVEVVAPDSLDAGWIEPSFFTLLHTVKTENLLSNIVIVTTEGRTVVDLGNFSEPGELNPFIELDFSAVTLARSGLSAFTSLYRSGDNYMKSAYAPIFAANGGVIGILGVEAGATYFDTLRALTNGIVLIDVASLVIIVVLGFLFYRQSLSLDRAQAAVIQGENLATMGRMVAGIAHEIRNPLSIIKASAERLGTKNDNDDEMLAYISEEVDHLNRILTGYLNFAKAERQQPRPYALQGIVKRCVMLLKPELEGKSIQVTERYPENDVVVMVDDKRIQQAVLNVMINAMQALDSGGAIEIVLDVRPKSAIVAIKDDGPGIDSRYIKEITKPFYTTKKHGSGLGMSIVSNIMDEHGGSVDIRSESGSGTEVMLTLPLSHDMADKKPR